MQSRAFQEQLEILSLNQSTRPYVGLVEQRNLVISFPSADRQREIVHAFERAAAPLDMALQSTERQIRLAREYRVRLFSDVVTGKLDIREAALTLPAEEEVGTIATEGPVEEEELESIATKE